MFYLAYFDKDGNGFCGSKEEPWLLDGYATKEDAKQDKERLEAEGYINVHIISNPKRDV